MLLATQGSRILPVEEARVQLDLELEQRMQGRAHLLCHCLASKVSCMQQPDSGGRHRVPGIAPARDPAGDGRRALAGCKVRFVPPPNQRHLDVSFPGRVPRTA